LPCVYIFDVEFKIALYCFSYILCTECVKWTHNGDIVSLIHKLSVQCYTYFT
jgi:hypothetical protein